MTVAAAIRDAAARIGEAGARADAELLMAHALDCSRSQMLLHRMQEPAPAAFDALLARRLADEPVAYIVGQAEFYGRPFIVTPAVLIPRADSETTLAAALAAAPAPRQVLDCGSGSGCLLLSLLAERPDARGIGVDRSAATLPVARANAELMRLSRRAALVLADWTEPGWAEHLGRFDLIVANPPYVEADAVLDASVRDYEPAGALFAGPDGLDAYRVLLPQLRMLSNPGGVVVVEIGWRQAEAVAGLATAAGFFCDLSRDLSRDLAGRPRALTLWINDPAA